MYYIDIFHTFYFKIKILFKINNDAGKKKKDKKKSPHQNKQTPGSGSITDEFYQTFKEQIILNPTWTLPENRRGGKFLCLDL